MDNHQEKSIPSRSTPFKRKKEATYYSHVKIPMKGHKIIKLEIYDAEKMEGDNLCKCDAEICCQHVVKNLFLDEIYRSAQNLISKMTESIASENETRNTFL